MTDTQLLTVAITLLAIFIAMLVNNHRMTDLRTDVGLRISDLATRFDQRFEALEGRLDDMASMLRAEMRADRAELNAKLDSILTLMANMDQRVTRLEDRAH